MSPTELNEGEIEYWRRETDRVKYKKRSEKQVPRTRSPSKESPLSFFSSAASSSSVFLSKSPGSIRFHPEITWMKTKLIIVFKFSFVIRS